MSGASGASSTGPTAAPRRARSGFGGLGIWHADLEHVLETRDARRDEAGDRRQRADAPRARVPHGLVPRPGRRAPQGVRRDARAAASRRRPSSTRTTSRSATSPARRRRSRSSPSASASSAPIAAEHTDAKIVYELMPFDVNVHTLDAALEVVGGAARRNGGIAIDTWHMSKLGIAPDELRRIPLEYLSLGRAERRPVRGHGRPDRRDHQPPPPARRGRVRLARLRRGLPRITATRGRGASRCSPRSCATTRSTSSSGGPTRRPRAVFPADPRGSSRIATNP